MTVGEIVAPGTVITTYKSRGLLKGADETRRTVVGTPRAGIVPVGVRENEDISNRFYTALSLSTLEALSHEKGTKVEEKEDVTIQEKNITRLWNCPHFWDQNQADKPTLKEGAIVWATFENSEQIATLTLEQPEDKSPPLAFGGSKNGDLKPGEVQFPPLKLEVNKGRLQPSLNLNTPVTIFYQLEVFNWLYMELRQRLGLAK